MVDASTSGGYPKYTIKRDFANFYLIKFDLPELILEF